ncbi:MAG: 3-isopropylmalate dehydratase [Alphaproteobacteria bacterium]|jgi:3-isopropylmalate/(R)-2-methylmalate dehydratase small subunit|nr:3-isopropylmalate dehydratase [Alphaproteobacteria bacterium]MBT4019541.1 3-isopropylmalate dehydratase [Alphaproteobacteria bacterium]MBT4965673.1 3-isopropylmalate dehydratase [Alphaproteobacteria bacterium]MBT5158918.1 3-isopropylmalate dehydratase [Alphaproteobacteria bacterium]MBT5918630.1 3-isopropylmalate dehydratase [Alphaproteobacteria bacterium]
MTEPVKEGGRAWLFGDEVDTDVLAPGIYMKGSMEEMASHCLETVDPAFAPGVRPGDIVLAGANFGIGSSREQAAQALTILGIKAVVAKSYGGIFYRNALNFGLLAVTSQADITASPEDRLMVDGEVGKVTNLTTGETWGCDPVPPHLLDMIAAGGLVPSLERKLAAQQVK